MSLILKKCNECYSDMMFGPGTMGSPGPGSPILGGIGQHPRGGSPQFGHHPPPPTAMSMGDTTSIFSEHPPPGKLFQ